MYFSRSDRRGVLILFVALLAATGGVLVDRWLLHPLPQPLTLDEAAMDSLEQTWSGEEAPAGAGQPHAFSSGQTATGAYAVPVQAPETFAFDPNTADSTTLLRLGLAPWQVRSIYKYRARGGRYHEPEDFKRLYGMTPELWERLAPFIHIDPKYRYFTEQDLSDASPRARENPSSDTLSQGKFQSLTPVDLNDADTTLLKRIPGVASHRARQIVRYREQLGGFFSTDQLKEIEAIPEELYPWFKVETGVRRKLNINTATVAQLGRHPYMGYTRARAIEDYRRVHGAIRSIDELRLLPDFTEAAIARLQPYIEY